VELGFELSYLLASQAVTASAPSKQEQGSLLGVWVRGPSGRAPDLSSNPSTYKKQNFCGSVALSDCDVESLYATGDSEIKLWTGPIEEVRDLI
jgi:hypothetical protein